MAAGTEGLTDAGSAGLGVGGPGARQPRSERRSGLEDPGLGAEEERAGREGSSWGDLGASGWWGPDRRGCGAVGRTCLQDRASGSATDFRPG